MNTPISKKQHKDPKSETKRRSARLRAKVLNNLNTANDSFVNLENELQIVNMESNTTITPFNNTPAKNKYKNQNLGRPLKEYMALKSRMSCLLTPNVKQLNSSESKNKTRKTDDRKASVSDKLLAELYNLYGD
ncbi:uncharacterized protein LOC105426492 [Pogonomyrmex barbatus]|uniref:Uncharacterized protein LOC105426492 n=1 Tax=Pogonomyrmex barbatus TaxID=144034 RepID=A0A6I9WB05_9HYME|nr:uncharacterized protein LOC105426492 [Pogonomyrmex barbatus]